MTHSSQTADDPAVQEMAPARDLMSKFDGLIAERQALLDSGVRDPFAIVMEQVLSPTEAVIQGKKTILLVADDHYTFVNAHSGLACHCERLCGDCKVGADQC